MQHSSTIHRDRKVAHAYQQKSRHTIFRNIIRVCFAGLFIFELANFVGLLHFQLAFTWFGLLLTQLVVLSAVEGSNYLLEKRWETYLHWSVWPLIFVSLFIDAFGDIGNYYDTIWWYDVVAHAIGGFTTTLVVMNIIIAFEKARHFQLPAALRYTLAYALALTLGTYYEIEEYLEDVFTGSHRSGLGTDTVNDLLMNTIGASLVLVILFSLRYVRRRNAIK